MKGAALAGASVAAAGSIAGWAPKPAPVPQKWDQEADLVIVGFGGAGASTAIAATDLGAKVLLLEKAPQGEEGGNTRVSGNMVFDPYPADKAMTYFKAMAGLYACPDPIIQLWAEEMHKNPDWIKSMGGSPFFYNRGIAAAEFKELPGAECVNVWRNTDGPAGQEQLWKVIKENVDKRKVPVLFGTAAKELVQNPQTGEILGVMAEQGGKTLAIKAKRAVVMACGGFENNQDMIRNYVTNMPYFYPMGTPFNTGDGIKMVMSVGADLWHMNLLAGSYLSYRLPGTDYTFHAGGFMTTHHNLIWVAADGTRFMKERDTGGHGKVIVKGQWVALPTPVPVHAIFDEEARKAGPLVAKVERSGWAHKPRHKPGAFDWSDDNRAEIAKGWIIKADSIKELAQKIKKNADVVQKAVDTYNAYAKAGKDPEFGRDPKLMKPIETPPYYAVELVPCGQNTQGGARRNEKMQVLRPNGTPIPRLYEVGEMGDIYGLLYNAGGNVGGCMAFGRVCARIASAEKPWDGV